MGNTISAAQHTLWVVSCSDHKADCELCGQSNIGRRIRLYSASLEKIQIQHSKDSFY